MMNKKKELVLGTAQWGWTIGREKAFEILEHWLNAGFFGWLTAPPTIPSTGSRRASVPPRVSCRNLFRLMD
jgi:hypothetical protein